MIDEKDIIIHEGVFAKNSKGVIVNMHGTASTKSIKMTVGGVEVPPDVELKLRGVLNLDNLPELSEEEMLVDGWVKIPEELK